MEKTAEKAMGLMKEGYICDNCLGRQFAELLSGMSNKERGKIIRTYVAFLLDSGEKIGADSSNFHGFKFRNVDIKPKEPEKCRLCKNFFLEKIDDLAEKVVAKLNEYEYDTFLIGSVVPDDLGRLEEKVWEEAGIDFVEPIKSEINRELGKRVESATGKGFDMEDPDITTIVNLETGEIQLQIKSLYIYGKYQKLVRGISQTTWLCRECGGKGCVKCGGEGRVYKTSVQEIVEKPLFKASKAKRSKFHGAGREDVDARCLGKRPFIIELVKPRKRNLNLKRIQSEINKSKKVKVGDFKIATKDDIKEVKFSKYDKTYLAEVTFSKKIDEIKLKALKKLKGEAISQKTPKRVSHRRADIIRKRKVKEIGVKQTGPKKLELKIRAESGLYIKEMIGGDDSRTQPNVAEMLGNKVKSIRLDVIKIHTNRSK
jgi:tRNA pseudouridine synthase 10